MAKIIFLPPIFNDACGISSNKKFSNGSDFGSYTPNTVVNRVYKSPHRSLIIYEIEQIDSHDNLSSITAVSSQKNSHDIKKLYKELRYEPIADLLSSKTHTHGHVNIFGVVLGMNCKEDDPKCTTLQLFDFDLNHPITVKLWRGLANWITSLSIGARLQIRNLLLKDSVLHSSSITEIYLLAHGTGNKSGALSYRVNNLNDKEREILVFLNHQSLLIPNRQLQTNNSSLKLAGPLYLEHKNDKWIIEGTANNQNSIIVVFLHFDAKVWQVLNEIFMDNSNKYELLFEKLNCKADTVYEYLKDSTLSFHITSSACFNHKKLSWSDLISSKIILFGTFELEAILDQITSSNSEESLGNLSVLPHEISMRSIPILRNPKDPNQFVYPENNASTTQNKIFKVQAKTILNDGNVKEIIKKTIFIL